MKFPDSNCCRCHSPRPAFRYTRTFLQYYSRYTYDTHTFDLPMCETCYAFARRRNRLENANRIIGALVIFAMILGAAQYASTVEIISVDAAINGGLIVVVVAIIMSSGVVVRLLGGRDYMKVRPFLGYGPVRIGFKNRDYHLKFREMNADNALW